MVKLSEWLPRLCINPDRYQHSWATAPFIITVGGQDWTVATNGMTLAALAGHLPGYEPIPANHAPPVAAFLAPVEQWHESIPFGLLRRWCGPAKYVRKHVRPSDPARRGRMLGTVLDRNLLACSVQGLEGETIRWWWSNTNTFLGPVTLEPDRVLPTGQAPWRVVIMPMQVSDEERRQSEQIAVAEIDAGWLAWNDGTVGKLARQIQEAGRFGDLPILADALEEAGCDNADLLGHCRAGGQHPYGCWLLAALLGKG